VGQDAAATVTNTVTVTGGGETNLDNDSAADQTAIIPPPDLTIAKSHAGSFTQGQHGAAYTLTVTNAGGGPTVALVSVTDAVPGGLTATGIAGAGWNCAIATATCTRSDALPAAASYPPIIVNVDVAGNAPPSVTNTAAVSGGGDANTANNTAADPTDVVQLPDLVVSSTHGGSLTQGQAGAAYTLTVTNVGAGPTSGVVTVSDTVPAALSVTAVSGAGWACTTAPVSCTRTDVLAAGASYPSISLTVDVAGNAPASVTNTVSVNGGSEGNTANDTASDVTAIVQVPDLTVASTHSGTFVQGQSGAVYTLVVSNIGPGATVGAVSVQDTLPPAGLTATAMSGSGWSCTPGNLTCTRSDSLASGASYLGITVVVTVASDAPASLNNTAAVGGGGESNTANDTATDTTTIVAPPDLTIAKSHTGSFTQGQTGATYRLTVTNAGGGPTSGLVSVADVLPGGLTATAMGGAGWSCTLGTLTCTRSDTLAAAASHPVITLTVDVASSAPANVTNTATVSGGGETNVTNNAAADPTAIVQLPDLTVSSVHTAPFAQGQAGATYTLTVSNSGAGPTAGLVTVTDTLPAGLTATAFSGAGWTCTLPTLTCTRNDTLAAGASYPPIGLVVDISMTAAANVANVVTVSGGGETNAANDVSSDATTIVQLPDLTVTSVHGSFTQGQAAATYTLTVSNNGSGPTTSAVTLQDTLPAALTAASLTGAGWTCTLGALTCARADALSAGASYPSVTLTVSVASNAPPTVTNTVTVGGGGESNTANDAAGDITTIVAPPDLTIAKSHSGSFTQGQTGATYSLTVANIGGGPTVGLVSVTDALPSGLTATAMAGSGWACVVNTMTCTRSDVLTAGASYPALTLTVDVATSAPANVTNTAVVSGGGDSSAANNTATDPTAVVQLPDLTVTVAHAGSFTQGQSGAAYTLTVTNAGAGATSGAVTVVDTLPTGLTATSYNGSGWSCTLSPLSCTRGDVLAAGLSYPAITLTVDVGLTAAASLTNTSSVSGGGETATSNDTASDLTAIVQLPDLVVASTHAGPFVQGQSAAYSLLVTNNGAASGSGVVSVADTLPNGLAASGMSGAGWSCSLGSVTCTRSDVLAPGASYPPITLTVSIAADASSNLTNAAVVAGGGEANTANDTANDSTTILSAVDLIVTKTHAGSFTQGQTGASYTVTVTNTGGAPTGGLVTVADALPAGLSATAIAGSGWSCTLSTTTCTRSDVLSGGASYPAVTVTVNVANNAASTLNNTATVSGGGDNNGSNNTASDATSILQLPDVAVTLTHTGTFTQGQVGATYTLSVRNVGANATSGTVTLVDSLPTGLTATGLAGSGWTCSLAGLTCTRGDSLAAGAAFPDVTLTVNIAASAPPSITNNATVSGGGQNNTGNDTASDTAAVVQVPDVAISLSHAGTFTQGQTGATYTLTVSNTGAGPTAGTVTVTDTLPVGLSATALSGTGWTCTTATLTCTRSDLLPAAAAYPPITLTVSVANNAPASVTNGAAVSGGGEVNTANDSASDVTTIAPGTSAPLFVTEAHFAIDQNTSGQNRATLSLNASGTNTLLIAALHVEFDGGDTNWVATDNGIAGTVLLKTDGYNGGAGNQRFQIFYWINPPSGTNSIVIQGTFTGSNEITASAVLLQNVSQTAPFGAMALDVSPVGRTSETETVAATSSDLVLHAIADAVLIRGTLGPGETSLSVANDGLQKLNAGDGDASIWIASKPGASLGTTVSSGGWPSSPSPSPRPLNALAIVLHGATTGTPAPINADVLIDMLGAGAQGTQLTPTVLNAGTVGTTRGWSVSPSPLAAMTVGPHRESTFVGVSIGGTNYPTTHLSQSMAFDHSQNYSYAQLLVPTGHTACTVAGWITFGPPAVSGGSVFDYVRIENLSGHFVVLQLANAAGAGYLVRAHTDGNGTLLSPGIHINPGGTYWFSLRADYVSGIGSLVIFDQTGQQIGSTQTIQQTTGGDCRDVLFGNVEVGTAAGFTSYFENLIVDYTAAAFPLGPGAGGADLNPPSSPASLTASLSSATQVALNWTGSTDNVGVAGYLIERCQGAGCSTFTEIASAVGTGTTFVDTVAQGALYSYRVRASDAAGNTSSYSNTSSVAVPDTQAPSAPGTVTATAASATIVNLSWIAAADNVGVADYWVERCPGVCTTTGFVRIATAAGTAFNDTGLTPNTTYSYALLAEDAAGNVGPSSNVSVVTTPASDTTPPSVPTGLTSSGITASQIALSWAAATDNVAVAGYHVFRNGVQIGTASLPTYLDSGLAAATTYTYSVTAFDATGNESAPSSSISPTTASVQPSTPTLVQHVAGGMDNNYATTLTITLPNAAGAGNALLLGVRFNGLGSVTSVADDRGNTWLAGPTVTNSSSSITTRMDLYYALNVAAATQTINITFAGLGGPTGNNAYPQAVISEFYNVASVSALDGSRANATSRTTGAITTTVPGDLIYEWGVDVSAIDYNYGIQFNGSSITAGPGFTLLSADLQTGSADQYMVQTVAGNVSPTFTASGTDTWSSLAIALKSALAGTPPPLGIRIVHMQHTVVAWPGHTTPVTLAFPSSGNLLAGLFTGTIASIAGVTDSNNNTWLSAGNSKNGTATSAQLVYAPNAVTGPTLSNIVLNLNPACSSNDCSLLLYDISGATTSPFDLATMSSGDQTDPGQVTMGSQTPSAANELTLIVGAISYHTINSIVGPGYVLDAQVNAFDDDGPNGGTRASRLDMDNAFAHIYTGAVSPVSFTFTATTRNPGGVRYWSAVTAAFFGVPPAPDTVPPSSPLNLNATGVSASQINLTWSPSSDNVGVAGYQIYRGGTQVGTSWTTSFADTGLSPQTTFTYTVAAFDAAGNVSPQSATVAASTTAPDVTAPSVPSNLQAANLTSNSVTISWSASTDDFGVAGYQVFRNGVLLNTTTALSYTDNGLNAATTYAYNVAAFDATGNVSAQSTPLNVTTTQLPPTPPAFVKLKENRVTASGNSISTGAFASPVSNGNLIAVWIWYNSNSQKVSTMTDTAGNTYVLAVGPTTGTGTMSGWRQEIWYAKNVIGGASLNVTATFAGTFNAEKSITAHEYSGLDQVAPLDVTAAAATTVANASTGTATTKFANELIFAGALFQGSGSAGTGFTRRSSMANNVSEDRVVSAVGSYAGTFTNTAQSAIVQMVAFKAAGQ
jgi:uncharacterized repeat protein (TIGR01451 family)